MTATHIVHLSCYTITTLTHFFIVEASQLFLLAGNLTPLSAFSFQLLYSQCLLFMLGVNLRLWATYWASYDLTYHSCILRFSCCGVASISCSQQLLIKDGIFQRAFFSSSTINSSHINLLLNISPSLSDQHSYKVNQWWQQGVALTHYATHSFNHHQQLWEFQVARGSIHH